MAAENLFVEGIDPTPLTSLGASELLQLIQQATPESYIGFLYVGETEPDIVNNTHYTRFLWLTPSTGALQYYTGAAWATAIIVTSLSGSALTAQSVPISKLDPDSVADALKLIRVNTAGDQFEYIAKASLYSSGELAVIKLTPGTANQFLMTVGGVTTWTTLSDSHITTALGTNKLTITALLSTGSAYAVPRQNSSGNAVEWATPATLFPNGVLPVANLNATGASADNVLKINSSGVPVWGSAPSPTITLTPVPSVVVFTGTGSWTCPAGVSKFRVRAWGGGGGGSGAVVGGGAGEYVEQVFTAIQGDYTITVGAGGAVGNPGTVTTVTDPTATVILTANPGLATGVGGSGSTPATGKHIVDGGAGNGTFGGFAANGGQGGYNTTPGLAPGAGGGVNSIGGAGRVIIEY